MKLDFLKNSDVQLAVALISILFMMFLPLPPLLMDILLSISIILSFLVLLVSIYIKEPLEFSTFPTFLLLSTLYRLSLNVATTRSILLDGASGNISSVIVAFGNFVVGGNYFVGLVIFIILILINFMVITKGAGRVAEVGARFTLDAMPGKQMSIDADLNAGIIDREEAKKRRQKIEDEADFYGAMDGASKFVRGDAIAGIIITVINIVVGLLIGVFQYNMSFMNAAQTYTLLTVGDGLVSQIPAIVISVAAGIVVTRANSDNGLSKDLSRQLFMQPRALNICCGLLVAMAFIPGLPSISFLALAAGFLAMARVATKKRAQESDELHKQTERKQLEKNPKEDHVETLLHIEPITLEVGVDLIPLVDKDQNGEILDRIVSTRKQFAQDLGIIVPMVMVKDNIQLKPNEYHILLKGNTIAKGYLLMDHELAMAPEENFDPIEGLQTTEPAYGLSALWIKSSQREEASFRGYTVVNCATVVVTHLSKVITDHAHELLGRQETQKLVEGLKERYPKVVEEVLSTDGLSLGQVVLVLKNLLKENVSIRDLTTIFECLADHVKETHNPNVLTRFVRKALGRNIIKRYIIGENKLHVASLERSLEDLLSNSLQVQENGDSYLSIDPEIAQKLLNNIALVMSKFHETGSSPLLLCTTSLRTDLKKLIQRFIPGVAVLAFDEIPPDIKTQNVGIITI